MSAKAEHSTVVADPAAPIRALRDAAKSEYEKKMRDMVPHQVSMNDIDARLAVLAARRSTVSTLDGIVPTSVKDERVRSLDSDLAELRQAYGDHQGKHETLRKEAITALGRFQEAEAILKLMAPADNKVGA